MKTILEQTISGDYILYDEEEDAPLVAVMFHNEAKRIPQATKYKMVLQMMGEGPMPTLPNLRTFLFGMIMGIGLLAAILRLVQIASH